MAIMGKTQYTACKLMEGTPELAEFEKADKELDMLLALVEAAKERRTAAYRKMVDKLDAEDN